MPFTTLETTNFPLYAVNVLDREHFSIAGGGGAAKTGVPNALVGIALFLLFLSKYFIFIVWCIVSVTTFCSIYFVCDREAISFEGNRFFVWNFRQIKVNLF